MDKFSKTKNFFQKISKINKIKQAITLMSLKEFLVFLILSIVMTVSAIFILWNINQKFMVEIPSFGGLLTEGVIGSPRFVNPILSISDVDESLTALIYSGLMRKTVNGNMVENLAESYNVSKDGLVYTFKLKSNIYFHDKKPITADDVVFTINKAKDSILKSPKRINWEGITATKIDDSTVQFNLKQPYSSFLENTTLGILPSHVWKNIPPDQFSFSKFNIEAIGSGPYKIDSIKSGPSGPEQYSLLSFNEFILGKPFIKKLIIKFYGNEKDLLSALETNKVDQISEVTPNNAETLKSKGYVIKTTKNFWIIFQSKPSPNFYRQKYNKGSK